MRSLIKTMSTAGIGAMTLLTGLSAAEAVPASVTRQTDPAPAITQVFYRCGSHRCHDRRYDLYRPAYRPYYYRPYGYYYRPPFYGVF